MFWPLVITKTDVWLLVASCDKIVVQCTQKSHTCQGFKEALNNNILSVTLELTKKLLDQVTTTKDIITKSLDLSTELIIVHFTDG